MNLNLTGAMGAYLNNGNGNSSDILNRLVSKTKEDDNATDKSSLYLSEDISKNYNSLSTSLNNSNDSIVLLNKANKGMDKLTSILDQIKQKSTDIAFEEIPNQEDLRSEIVSLIKDYDLVIENSSYKNQFPLKTDSEPLVFSVGDENEKTLQVDLESMLSTEIGFDKPYVLANYESNFTDENLKEEIEPYKLTVELKKDGKTEKKEVMLPLKDSDKMDLQLQASILLAVVNQAISVISQNKKNSTDISKELESLTKNILNLRTNVKSTLSSIPNLDYSNESSTFSKLSVLSKSGSLLLAQANSVVKGNIQNLIS